MLAAESVEDRQALQVNSKVARSGVIVDFDEMVKLDEEGVSVLLDLEGSMVMNEQSSVEERLVAGLTIA